MNRPVARLVNWIARFPEGHEHAGQLVGRRTNCRHCGVEFRQFKVDPGYIPAIAATISEEAARSYAGSCQQVGENFYQPPYCPRCNRRVVRSTDVPAGLSFPTQEDK